MEIQVNLDCADADALAAFYCAALGYEPHGAVGQYRSLVAPAGSGPKLILQQVAEPKSAKNRMHLDLVVDDIEAEAARFVALGATRVQRVEEFGINWIVMHDPEGNELCLCDS